MRIPLLPVNLSHGVVMGIYVPEFIFYKIDLSTFSMAAALKQTRAQGHLSNDDLFLDCFAWESTCREGVPEALFAR